MKILGEAVEHSPQSRDAWIADACAGDESLCDEVVELLGYDEAENSFLEESPFSTAVQIEPEAVPVIGRHVGPYKITREIGRGGMGAVYLGERDDEAFAKRVAIKLIKRGMDTDFVLQRFRNERQILANLDHPNIAKLLDGGTTEVDLPYFIMEYVEGQPITDYANAHDLTAAERLKLFRTVCAAVQYAHQNLIIHRDIKPSNILVAKDGEPKLLDFGIAKLLHADTPEEVGLTATAVRIMTPEYASPEQVKGERVTTATDVYSLGILLYQLLTGHRPYRITSGSPAEVARAVCEQQPEKPSTAVRKDGLTRRRGDTEKSALPDGAVSRRHRVAVSALRGDLDNIVLKALRKEPLRRYVSVEQFSEDIRRHLEGLPVSARKDTFAYRTSKFVQRNKIGVTAAAIILLILIAGIVITSQSAKRARIESARAQLRFNEVRELAHSVVFDYHDAIASLPGSTPVRERLVKDALKYLDNLADDEGNSPSLQRELAAAYVKVGDVQGRPYTSNLGQSEGALASYRKAVAILDPLSAASRSDKELTRELATAYERIGNIQLRKGDWADALKQNNEALTMRQALLATDPSNKNYRSEVADSYLYVGDALQVPCLDSECVRGALDSQRRALEIRQALAKEDPSDQQIQRNIAQAYSRVGFRLAYLGFHDDKKFFRSWLENEQAALAIRKELAAANPTNALDRRNFADQLMLTGTAQLENDDIAGALKEFQSSLDLFKGLSLADPTNSEAQRDLGFIYYRLAAAYEKAGNALNAGENYAANIRIDRQLLAADPTNQEDLGNLAKTYGKLEDISRAAGEHAGAIEDWQRAIDVRERMAAITPDNYDYVSDLAGAYFFMGMLYAETAGAHADEKDLLLDVGIPPPTNAKQLQLWREARSWYQKSLSRYQDMKRKGMLVGPDVKRPDEIAGEIAKCEAQLKYAK